MELLREFQHEAGQYDGGVFTADLNPSMSPACRLAEKTFAVPRVTHPGYVDCLLDICVSNKVRLIILTIDTELMVLSQNRDRFEDIGVSVMVSDEAFVLACRDKRRTAELFDKIGIRNPQPRDKCHPLFPMFAKPYDGSLSTNIHVLKSQADLTPEILNDPKLLFMEYIDKSQYREFTVDMYYGADNRVKSIVPRERIEIRSGEVNKGATRKNHIVEYLKSRMSCLHGVRGCICVQLFYREYDKDIVGVEINPRFGGGYPLSYHAEANYPSMLIKEYILGESIEYSEDWLDNMVMLRFDSQVVFRE